MKINYKALLPATVPAILVCMIFDAAVEYILSRFTGISFLSFFEQKLHIHYGTRFFLLNFYSSLLRCSWLSVFMLCLELTFNPL